MGRGPVISTASARAGIIRISDTRVKANVTGLPRSSTVRASE